MDGLKSHSEIVRNNPENRDYFFDNLKLFLIWSIILKHSLDQFVYSNIFIKSILLWTDIFSIPAFVFVSGYFYKHKFSFVIKKILKYFLLYLIFQTYYIFFLQDNFQFATPNYTLWYLVSLCTWYLISLLLPANKFTIALAVILSLISGNFELFGQKFSLARTIYFLPFFLGGRYVKSNNLFKIKRGKILPISGLIMLFAMIFLANSYWKIDIRLFYGSYGYEVFPVLFPFNMMVRFIGYLLSCLAILFLIRIIPNKNQYFTYLGKETLFIYILHGFLIAEANLVTKNLHSAIPILIAGTIISSLIILMLGQGSYVFRKIFTKN